MKATLASKKAATKALAIAQALATAQALAIAAGTGTATATATVAPNDSDPELARMEDVDADFSEIAWESSEEEGMHLHGVTSREQATLVGGPPEDALEEEQVPFTCNIVLHTQHTTHHSNSTKHIEHRHTTQRQFIEFV